MSRKRHCAFTLLLLQVESLGVRGGRETGFGSAELWLAAPGRVSRSEPRATHWWLSSPGLRVAYFSLPIGGVLHRGREVESMCVLCMCG